MTATVSSKAPDGGWGWVIVAAVFGITFLSFGTMYSIGILFDVFIAEFRCTKSETSTMASIAFSLQCFLGPLVSLLQQRFQPRIIVFAGCLLISIAFVTSSFAPNIICLYFTFGIIGGTGLAMAYLPMVVLISFYFTRKRSLATALACIGSFAGCFVHPYLLQFLLSIYGWRGTLLLIGGIALNSLALTMLLRPLSSSGSFEKRSTSPDQETENKLTDIQAGSRTESEPLKDDLPPRPIRLDSFKEDESSAAGSDGALFAISDSTFDLEGEAADVIQQLPSLPSISDTNSENQEGRLDNQAMMNNRPAGTRRLSERFLSSYRWQQRRQSAPSVEIVVAFSKNDSQPRRISLTNEEPQPSVIMGGLSKAPSKISSFSGLYSSGIFPSNLLISSSPSATTLAHKQKKENQEQDDAGAAKTLPRLKAPVFNRQLSDRLTFVRRWQNRRQSAPPNESQFVKVSEEQTRRSSVDSPDGSSSHFHRASSRPNLSHVSSFSAVYSSHVFPSMMLLSPSGASFPTSVSKGLVEKGEVSKSVEQSSADKIYRQRLLKIIQPLLTYFRIIKFSSFLAANFFVCMTFYAPSMFIVDWGKQLGIPGEKTTLLLSLVGVGNIIGRPLMAFFGDLLAGYKMLLFAGVTFFAGVMTVLTNFVHNFYFLVFFVFQFAFLIGGSQTFLTPILAEILPLSELASAFGILIAAEGVAFLIGSPLLALMPTYGLTFCLAGLLIISASSSVVIVHFRQTIFFCIPSCKEPAP